MTTHTRWRLQLLVWMTAGVMACGGDDEGTPADARVDRNGEPDCPGASLGYSFEEERSGRDCDVHACRWYCIEHEGEPGQNVTVQFERCGSSPEYRKVEEPIVVSNEQCSSGE